MSALFTGSLTVLIIIGAANGIIGGLIGICGIAGFLLPMLYTGALGFPVDQALAFSFLAFFVSGILGSMNYHKAGNLDIPLSIKLGAGSLIGAVAGVLLQAMISKETAKTILYFVVLFSGLSILYRMWSDKKKSGEDKAEKESKLTGQLWFLLILGIVTGAICSLSGAGGPVLVMPLLITVGVSARTAVGVALFDSVFIAIPACIGYLSRIDWKNSLLILVIIAVTHGAGVLIGSHYADKVPVKGLKIFVAVFSVFIAAYMLI
ncbi:MAG: sulfite exporter TauE/SafE family protein [Eubacteriales bacterium]|nr:sulfite exporter TauE/SafE family protein [Eubacteriales bacterium]